MSITSLCWRGAYITCTCRWRHRCHGHTATTPGTRTGSRLQLLPLTCWSDSDCVACNWSHRRANGTKIIAHHWPSKVTFSEQCTFLEENLPLYGTRGKRPLKRVRIISRMRLIPIIFLAENLQVNSRQLQRTCIVVTLRLCGLLQYKIRRSRQQPCPDFQCNCIRATLISGLFNYGLNASTGRWVVHDIMLCRSTTPKLHTCTSAYLRLSAQMQEWFQSDKLLRCKPDAFCRQFVTVFERHKHVILRRPGCRILGVSCVLCLTRRTT